VGVGGWGWRAGTVTVDFATRDGSASSGSDYTATTGTLTFADGEVSKAITIPIQEDALAEGNEVFQILLSNPTGVSLGSLTEATVSIAANATAGVVEFSTSAITVPEGGQCQLLVTRTGGSQGRISVDYRVTGGTATPAVGQIDPNNTNEDFYDSFGTITFEDGQATAEIE